LGETVILMRVKAVEGFYRYRIATMEGRSLAVRVMLAIINDFDFRARLWVDSTLADGDANGGSSFSKKAHFVRCWPSSGAVPGQFSAMMIAIQQAPEWLQPFLLIITASHLPPIDKMVSGDSKRTRSSVWDSVDEENGGISRRVRKSVPL
jgi:hypothetical protein